MNMRLDDGGDAQPLALRQRDVLLDVAIRVDHERLAHGGAADQIARLCQLVVIDMS